MRISLLISYKLILIFLLSFLSFSSEFNISCKLFYKVKNLNNKKD
nr:MAG TPA: hypothetical protein [Caudoviricetes sp.]